MGNKRKKSASRRRTTPKVDNQKVAAPTKQKKGLWFTLVLLSLTIGLSALVYNMGTQSNETKISAW